MPYGIEKTPATAAIVIQLEFHALEEDQDAKDMGIEDTGVAGLFGDAAAKFGEAELNELVKGSGDRILWLGFVDESAAESLVGMNEAFEGFASVLIDEAIEAF
ncbi:MAG: hypothetical protein ACK5TN_20250 [Acidobacteriota bacterium]